MRGKFLFNGPNSDYFIIAYNYGKRTHKKWRINTIDSNFGVDIIDIFIVFMRQLFGFFSADFHQVAQ